MTGRGHRILPHTADLIVEAWGPDIASCIEEAVTALVSTCVDARAARIERIRAVRFGPGSDEQLLLDTLEEVVFTLDTSPDVPVRATVHRRPDDYIDVELHLAATESVQPAGPGPKAISRSGLAVDASPDGVRCSFLVDV